MKIWSKSDFVFNLWNPYATIATHWDVRWLSTLHSYLQVFISFFHSSIPLAILFHQQNLLQKALLDCQKIGTHILLCLGILGKRYKDMAIWKSIHFPHCLLWNLWRLPRGKCYLLVNYGSLLIKIFSIQKIKDDKVFWCRSGQINRYSMAA